MSFLPVLATIATAKLFRPNFFLCHSPEVQMYLCIPYASILVYWYARSLFMWHTPYSIWWINYYSHNYNMTFADLDSRLASLRPRPRPRLAYPRPRPRLWGSKTKTKTLTFQDQDQDQDSEVQDQDQDQDQDSAVSRPRPRLWCPRPRPRLKTYKTNTGSPWLG